jgi:hypothetical protein
MAISEVCQLEVREEVDKAVKNGKLKSEALKELQKFYKGIGIHVKYETLRKKEQRASKKVGTDVPVCKRCEKNQVKMSPKTKKPMDHGLCQNCRSADLKKDKAKPRDKKNGKVINISPAAEDFWQDLNAEVDKFFKRPVHGAVGEKVLNKVLRMRKTINARIDELEKASKP